MPIDAVKAVLSNSPSNAFNLVPPSLADWLIEIGLAAATMLVLLIAAVRLINGNDLNFPDDPNCGDDP